jgi:hypothetical protein
LSGKGLAQMGPGYLYGDDVKFSKYIIGIEYCKVDIENIEKISIKKGEKIHIYRIADSITCRTVIKPNRSNLNSFISIKNRLYDIDSLLYDGRIVPVMQSCILSCYRFEHNGEKYIAFFIFNLAVNSSRPTSKLMIFNCTRVPYIVLNEWQCRNNFDGIGYSKLQPDELVYLQYDCGTIVNEYVLTNGFFEKRKKYFIKKGKTGDVFLTEKKK